MRDIMDDVMQKFDQDANKTIDYNEFKEIISDADVDLMFSLYWNLIKMSKKYKAVNRVSIDEFRYDSVAPQSRDEKRKGE